MSRFPVLGGFSKAARGFCCRRIFAYCGKNVNIERNAFFWAGTGVRLGDRSGLGVNCSVPSDIRIGRDVTFTPGRTVGDGTVIGAGTLLCKDFPPYSIVGGNPARLIRSRK